MKRSSFFSFIKGTKKWGWFSLTHHFALWSNRPSAHTHIVLKSRTVFVHFCFSISSALLSLSLYLAFFCVYFLPFLLPNHCVCVCCSKMFSAGNNDVIGARKQTLLFLAKSWNLSWVGSVLFSWTFSLIFWSDNWSTNNSVVAGFSQRINGFLNVLGWKASFTVILAWV